MITTDKELVDMVDKRIDRIMIRINIRLGTMTLDASTALREELRLEITGAFYDGQDSGELDL